MKKILIYISIFIYLFSFVPLEVSANNKTQQVEISKIENELFGFDYSKDDINKRVARLEERIYGKEVGGNLQDRLKK